MPKKRNYRFKAEFTSKLGQYSSVGFLAPNYARAWEYITDSPRWAIAAVAPISGIVEPPLGATYHAVMRVLKDKGAFRYRS